jgi:phage terminase small subunit
MNIYKDRYTKLLEVLPKHKGKIAPAAVEAGFSEQTAYKQGKRLLKTAIKRQAQNTIALMDNKNVTTTELKKTLADRIGMSSEEVFNLLANIARQDRDYTSALKVLKPLAKDVGVDLTEDDSQKTVVPILNVTVKEKSTAIQSHIKEIAPDTAYNADCTTENTEAIEEGTPGVQYDPAKDSE